MKNIRVFRLPPTATALSGLQCRRCYHKAPEVQWATRSLSESDIKLQILFSKMVSFGVGDAASLVKIAHRIYDIGFSKIHNASKGFPIP